MFWFAVGALVTYLFDPVSGRGRRSRLFDQTRARVDDAVDEVGARARYQAGRARGVVHETMHREEPPRTDEQLLQKVRSEAVGMVPGSTAHVEVRVDDGVVRLIGHSRDQMQERELIERIQDVTGVREVRNELVPA
jgi:osmotically-inducible protein OsmY